MPDQPSADAILSEARGAHTTSREILGLLQETDDDPIAVILATLQAIQATQASILTRLDIMGRQLAGLRD